MAGTRWHAKRLVGLTVPRLAQEVYEQLRDLDQALRAEVFTPTTLDSLSDVVITTGAAHDTLRFDGTTWRNSAFLQNTTTQVRIGGNPGTLPNPAVTPILTGLGGGYYFKATTGNAYSLMFGDGVPAGHSILSQGAGGWAELDLEYYGTGTGPPNLYFSRARGTTTAPDYPQSGDLLGRLEYHSYAGAGVYPNDRAEGARFDCLADGTWTVSSRPTRFEMYTTPSGTTASVKRLTLGENGFLTHTAADLVQLGTITAAQAARADTVTWNNGSVIFTGWLLNVTNTASNPTSAFMRLQGGGTDRIILGTPFSANSPLVDIRATAVNNQTALALSTLWTTTSNAMVIDATGAIETGQFILMREGGATRHNIGRTTAGIFGGGSTSVGLRVGGGNSSTFDASAGGSPVVLGVGALFSSTHTTSMTLIETSGLAGAGTYTTGNVYQMRMLGFLKGASQTITTWYGLKIEAGPTAGTKWAIYTDDPVRVGGDLTVTGAISGGSFGAHTHVETDIVDGSLLARVAASESITGAWTFAPSTTATAIAVTQAVGAKGIVVAGGTQTTSQPVLDLAQTWNAGAVAFDGIVLDVTNTASDSTSRLLALLTGATKRLQVWADGHVVLGNAGYQTTTGVWFNIPGVSGTGSKGFLVSANLTATANGNVLGAAEVGAAITLGGFTGVEIRSFSIGALSAAAATNIGLKVHDITGATNNYAIYTGSGRVRLGGVIETAAAQESTGAGSAALGSNSPAGTLTAPNTWLAFMKSDGTTLYVPAWA